MLAEGVIGITREFLGSGAKSVPDHGLLLSTGGILRWLDTVFFFSEPYLAFSTGIVPIFPSSARWENYTSFWKRIEVWLNVTFKVIDISMETIYQKIGNR